MIADNYLIWDDNTLFATDSLLLTYFIEEAEVLSDLSSCFTYFIATYALTYCYNLV